MVVGESQNYVTLMIVLDSFVGGDENDGDVHDDVYVNYDLMMMNSYDEE